ncbi:hypothetical protein [Egicoccus sp. AB-alg2]|uniref:hypothetical protein n=1 Tax=Egicoccus sp. AB-alg2 TaxID=3242693 RepID=UPI00359E8456
MRPPRRAFVASAVCVVVLAGCGDGGAADGDDGAVTGAPDAEDRDAGTAEPDDAPEPGGDADPEGAPEPDGAAEPDDPARSDGDEATTLLSVSGRSLDGGEVDLATLRGEDAVLWMWTPW